MIANIETNNRLLGIWDMQRSSLSIGGLLVWLTELLSKKEGETPIDLVFLGTFPNFNNDNLLTEFPKNYIQNHPILHLAQSFAGINKLLSAPNLDVLKESLKPNQITWPHLNDDDYEPGCYTHLQNLAAQGSFRKISFKEDLLTEAKKYISKHAQQNIPVVVHLKNNSQQPGCSNADFDEWYQFFDYCNEQFPVVFILIGNENIDPEIKKLPNVLITNERKTKIALELAIVQVSNCFMGMATGPSNMALLSGVPCAVFKNPNHHAEQMHRELGKHDHFSFSSKDQLLLRKFEHKELLIEQFERLYHAKVYSRNKKEKNQLRKTSEGPVAALVMSRKAYKT